MFFKYAERKIYRTSVRMGTREKCFRRKILARKVMKTEAWQQNYLYNRVTGAKL